MGGAIAVRRGLAHSGCGRDRNFPAPMSLVLRIPARTLRRRRPIPWRSAPPWSRSGIHETAHDLVAANSPGGHRQITSCSRRRTSACCLIPAWRAHHKSGMSECCICRQVHSCRLRGCCRLACRIRRHPCTRGAICPRDQPARSRFRDRVRRRQRKRLAAPERAAVDIGAGVPILRALLEVAAASVVAVIRPSLLEPVALPADLSGRLLRGVPAAAGSGAAPLAPQRNCRDAPRSGGHSCWPRPALR